MVTVLVLCLAVAATVTSYPTGAPPGACFDMVPQHEVKVAGNKLGDRIEAQKVLMPYKLSVSPAEFTAGLQQEQLTITLTGMGHLIRGFLIQARSVDRSLHDRPLGNFRPDSAKNVKTLNCGVGQNNAATHSKALENVDSLTLQWQSDSREKTHIQFVVTIVESYDVFWAAEYTHQKVYSPDIPRPQPAYETNQNEGGGGRVVSSSIPSFTYIGCGTTKGCYRYPENCAPEFCHYFLSWTPDGADVNFELTAKSSGWVAVGFSADKYMGEDSVIQCVYLGESGSTVGESHNTKEKDNILVHNPPSLNTEHSAANYEDGRMKCKFSRPRAHKLVRDINKPVHILMAKGEAHDGKMLQHDVSYMEGPVVSADPVSLDDTTVDIGNKATYPLIKAHAILMIIAFVACASTGMLIARYFKPMWPNNRSCGERIWFSTHRALMVNTLFLVIIAFVLIFVEAGGYSKMDKPWMAEAHPIIGIIVTCLVVINPLMALCRCDPKARCRPCFNWFHWFVGTVALVLATLNIFFGMNVSKANIPWWVTWVMVIWVIIHFIVEITLEIHQCCVHKKNKRRQEEYERKRRTDIHGELIPEPEPAGRRFKNGMLVFYVVMTVILVLIMVLSILILS